MPKASTGIRHMLAHLRSQAPDFYRVLEKMTRECDRRVRYERQIKMEMGRKKSRK